MHNTTHPVYDAVPCTMRLDEIRLILYQQCWLYAAKDRLRCSEANKHSTAPVPCTRSVTHAGVARHISPPELIRTATNGGVKRKEKECAVGSRPRSSQPESHAQRGQGYLVCLTKEEQKHKHTHAHTHIHTYRHRHTHTHTHRQSERERERMNECTDYT